MPVEAQLVPQDWPVDPFCGHTQLLGTRAKQLLQGAADRHPAEIGNESCSERAGMLDGRNTLIWRSGGRTIRNPLGCLDRLRIIVGRHRATHRREGAP